MFRRLLGLSVGSWLVVSCGGGLPATPAAPSKAPTTTADAFGDMGGVQCSAVRPQTEPDLMAWDSGSRMNLNTLRRRGVVAVRYQAEGCNVELEILPNCLAKGTYEYEPYSSNDSKVITNAQELYAELPLGAARLAGKLKGDRALRTDYQLVGMATLPPTAVISASSLEGPGCGKATHVISRIYLGGFAMASGEKSALEAQVSLFGAGLGGSTEGSASREASEGNPQHCQTAQSTGVEEKLCSVPLRIGLAPIEGAEQSACPDGAKWDGAKCVQTQVLTEVKCPAGTSFVAGKGCEAAVTKTCGNGLHFVDGQGCVPNVVAAVPSPAATTAQKSATAGGAPASGVMVRIPAGSFMMGSNDGDFDEKPVHRVTLAAFEVDRTEVTVTDYEACVGAGACEARSTVFGKHYKDASDAAKYSGYCNSGKTGRAQHPMNCVDWNDAGNYCRWVGKRLPSEEEWEYAARGTDGRTYPWGNQAPGSQLCWNRIKQSQGTCPVGSFALGASFFGLLDMAGSVAEWTSSHYSKTYGSKRSDDLFVNRGGDWMLALPLAVRAAVRNDQEPSARSYLLGFRCAR